MLIVALPAEYHPMQFRRLDQATQDRLNASLARDGYRAALRCEWPLSNACGGEDCGQFWLCDGCERTTRAAEVNMSINARAKRLADEAL